MGKTLDIGTRIELVSMDGHCQDISIGLYRQEIEGEPHYLVHTYSPLPGADSRIAFLVEAMCVLGGMEKTESGLLRFPCGQGHFLAVKRLFLEVCKLAEGAPLSARPGQAFDKKSNGNIIVTSLGDGYYQVSGDGDEKRRQRRVEATVGGLLKLGEMLPVEGEPDKIGFSCGHSHDALVFLLLPRALNVRAAMREQEQQASRGTLVAPSQQN